MLSENNAGFDIDDSKYVFKMKLNYNYAGVCKLIEVHTYLQFIYLVK